MCTCMGLVGRRSVFSHPSHSLSVSQLVFSWSAPVLWLNSLILLHSLRQLSLLTFSCTSFLPSGNFLSLQFYLFFVFHIRELVYMPQTLHSLLLCCHFTAEVLTAPAFNIKVFIGFYLDLMYGPCIVQLLYSTHL